MRKLLSVTLCFVIGLPALALSEEIYRLDQPLEKREESKPITPSKIKSKSTRPEIKSEKNLSSDFTGRKFERLETTNSAVVLPLDSLKTKLDSLRVGETLKARITHSILAFPDEKSVVVAEVEGERFNGSKLIGTSVLEKNSKRILIELHTITQGGKTYRFKGQGQSPDGQSGLIGEYHSSEGKYFAGNFLSSLVAAYFDGLIPREANVFGQIQTDTSIDSAFKKGLAGGAMASADRFKEKLKQVPEFSELKGPIALDVTVLEKGILF